jgi:hypothetical protein
LGANFEGSAMENVVRIFRNAKIIINKCQMQCNNVCVKLEKKIIGKLIKLRLYIFPQNKII